MEWNKETLRNIYAKIFGLDFTPVEMEGMWEQAQKRIRTPMAHGPTAIAVLPSYARTLIGEALTRTGLTLDHARFKKVSEEILPAIDFALLLKKIGLGEHLIIPRENPDIALIRAAGAAAGTPKPPYKIVAVPIEIMNINEDTLSQVAGTTILEKIENAIITKKFLKRYDPRTTLLILLDIDAPMGLDMPTLSERLCSEAHGFHQVWLEAQVSSIDIRFVMLCPYLCVFSLDRAKEVPELMY
jgi:hypothetical protein